MLKAEILMQLKHPIRRRLTIFSYIIHRRIKHQLKRFGNRPQVEIIRVSQQDDYDSHIVDDMPLTINRDPYPGSRLQQDTL